MSARRFHWEFVSWDRRKRGRASAMLRCGDQWVGGAVRYRSRPGWFAYLSGTTDAHPDRDLGRPCRTLAMARRRVEAAVIQTRRAAAPTTT